MQATFQLSATSHSCTIGRAKFKLTRIYNIKTSFLVSNNMWALTHPHLDTNLSLVATLNSLKHRLVSPSHFVSFKFSTQDVDRGKHDFAQIT